MRWDNLRPDGAADTPAVPLFGAVTRTFDTPAFRGMTFYEIRARSIINRVPAASHVPFDYTINPYRGCGHACTYCLQGDTPILMADGRTAPIAELKVGDRIYGTRQQGAHRRYVITEVLAHWSTQKLAHRVTLADGTRLVAGADHRFLTDHGWSYVTDSPRHRRPFLTSGQHLMGSGRFAERPKIDDDYRRGYLHATTRLAPTDAEALQRAAAFLRHADAPHDLGSPTSSWRKGFLAGAFDAGGDLGPAGGDLGSAHCGLGRASDGGLGRAPDADLTIDDLTITASDPALLDQIAECLDTFGFAHVSERPGVLRLRGGLPERLRFLHTVDPAVTRGRSLEGAAVKTSADLQVVAVEPLGLVLPLYDITTGTGDFIADGVVSHNCFARNTHTYLDLDAGLDFDSKVVVKVNAPDLARRELASPRWRGQGRSIAMGTNVDCYQRAEGRYTLMPGIIQALTDTATPFSILTKGTLILRDLDLLTAAAAVTDVSTAVSVGFVDADMWRAVEPGTPHPLRRLEACRTLNAAGIPCGVLMAPVLPYLTDSPAQLEETVRAIAQAGATHVSPIVLHLRPGAREWFLGWLGHAHPRLVPRYLELYGRGAYAPKAYQERIAAQVREAAARHGIGRHRRSGSHRITPPAVAVAAAGPEQLTLL
ncbi:intein-containing Rv2578c family radical SAM protein [Nonomuraea soli]|uniref:DNA repair photolyase n=1 Tax=Nonomuraea soli TaxID=1032476 RepID=A0A7W0CSL4_9ACTN|nr:intein-containing Rv2578c family radical SAM protein [Nonomuraea soli]MBA2896405.1 DNA repair photolyase [Nonomuraea soli]